jgi:hypothetical protein
MGSACTKPTLFSRLVAIKTAVGFSGTKVVRRNDRNELWVQLKSEAGRADDSFRLHSSE